MDSKTKAIATRVSLQDYAIIEEQAKHLGMNVSEWLQIRLIDSNIAKEEAEEWRQKHDVLLKENHELKKQLESWVSQFIKKDSRCSSLSNRNERLEKLLSKYDERWEREYRNLFG